MLCHYWDHYPLCQMQGWSNIGVTDGDKCVTKAVSGKLDNFLTTLSRAEAAAITSTHFESMIFFFFSHSTAKAISMNILSFKTIFFFLQLPLFCLKIWISHLGELRDMMGQVQHSVRVITKISLRSDYLAENSANPFSVQQGTYCRVPLELLWGDVAYSKLALKAVSGEGHPAQSVWLGANWTCSRQ